MTVVLILFALAAVGGIVLALQRFTGKTLPSLPLAIAHGIVAAAGLVALIAFIASGPGRNTVDVALGFLVVAALGGLFLFFGYHLRKRALAIPIVVIHALVAVTGFVVLLIAAMK